jgi:hypothetical protein
LQMTRALAPDALHYSTQWNNELLIPLSGVMKLTYPTEWSNAMRPVMKFLIPLK